MDRIGFLGGSDLAPLLGCSPYTTRRALWLEKTGQVASPDLSDNHNVRRGVRLEPVGKALFAWWSKERDPRSMCYGHIPEIPCHQHRRADVPAWAGGTPDMEWWQPADDETGEPRRLWVVDVKVVSSAVWRMLTEQHLVPPIAYRCQLDWYMEVYDYTGGILWLYCPELDAWQAMYVERDPVLGPLYLEEAARFMACVEAGADPGDGPMATLEAQNTLGQTEDLSAVAATPEAIAALNEAIVNLHGARALVRQAEGLEQAASARVHAALTNEHGQHFVGRLLAEGVRLSVSRVDTPRLNADRLAELAPLDRDAVLALCRQHGILPAALAGCALDLSRARITTVTYPLRTSTVTPSTRVDQ